MAKKKKKGAPRKIKVDRRAIIAVFVAIVVAAGTWFGFTAPAREKASTAATSYQDATTQLSASQKELADLKAGKKSSAQLLLNQVRKLDLLLPPDFDSILMLSRIQNLASESGVKVTLITSTASETTGTVTSYGYDVAVTGTVGSIADFAKSVESYQPLMTLDSITVTSGAAAPVDGTTPVAPTGSGAATGTLRLTVWSSSEPALKQL